MRIFYQIINCYKENRFHYLKNIKKEEEEEEEKEKTASTMLHTPI
jgi:hypothetical protein